MAIGAFDSDAFDVDAFSEDAFLFSEAGVIVPDVVGETQAAGTATLEGDGFVVAVETAYSSTVAVGLIISQSPTGGSEVASGSTVTITVSLGPQSDGAGSNKKRKDRRRRYYVERDGVAYIAESEQEAQRIAEQPKPEPPKALEQPKPEKKKRKPRVRKLPPKLADDWSPISEPVTFSFDQYADDELERKLTALLGPRQPVKPQIFPEPEPVVFVEPEPEPEPPQPPPPQYWDVPDDEEEVELIMELADLELPDIQHEIKRRKREEESRLLKLLTRLVNLLTP